MTHTNKSLGIVSISSEVFPFSETGGLAKVAGALPKSLTRLGHNVMIITPLYKKVQKRKWGLKKVIADLKIKVDDTTTVTASFWKAELAPGIVVYFVDHGKLFSERTAIYDPKNDHQRFYFFDIAAIELLLHLKLSPDIIQCHDWHTGLIPELLKKRYAKTNVARAATVFTIHNLAFQLGMGWWNVPVDERDKGMSTLPSFTDEALKYINFAKRAILNADVINTVSTQYREEIMTKEVGQDLHRILKNREGRLFGIVNGIDESHYNPATDPGLVENYSFDALHLRTKNKIQLQKMFKLPENPKIPIFSMLSRLSEQKGYHLLLKILPTLMRQKVQIIIFGGGDKWFESEFRKMMKKHPDKFGANLEFTRKHSTRVVAGTDFILTPSRFEPAGLSQLEGMRYGAIPIAHQVGGLADTVTDYDARTEKGNGFVFSKYEPQELLFAIGRAFEEHRHKESWLRLVRSVMRQSYSWEIPAKKYVKLFRIAIDNKRNNSK